MSAARTPHAMNTPKWEHDCEECRYLSSCGVEGEWVDWYHCDGSLGGSVVGRFGHDGPQYWSSPVGMLPQMESSFASAAKEAFRRKVAEEQADEARYRAIKRGRP